MRANSTKEALSSPSIANCVQWPWPLHLNLARSKILSLVTYVNLNMPKYRHRLYIVDEEFYSPMSTLYAWNNEVMTTEYSWVGTLTRWQASWLVWSQNRLRFGNNVGKKKLFSVHVAILMRWGVTIFKMPPSTAATVNQFPNPKVSEVERERER